MDVTATMSKARTRYCHAVAAVEDELYVVGGADFLWDSEDPMGLWSPEDSIMALFSPDIVPPAHIRYMRGGYIYVDTCIYICMYNDTYICMYISYTLCMVYRIHAIHATRYTRLYTVYPLPGGAAGAGAGAGAGGSPGARDAGGRAGAAGRGADAPGRAQVREFELLWPRERTRLTKKHKLRRFCYYMKGVPVRDPLLFPPKLLASFSRRVC